MLPSNLLTVWKRKGTIQPRYAKPSTVNLQIASDLIEAYKHGIGKKKSTLKKMVERTKATNTTWYEVYRFCSTEKAYSNATAKPTHPNSDDKSSRQQEKPDLPQPLKNAKQ